ncbi:MAG: hypothetical protein HN390_00135 [Anaerolineae bacterium]|jgi:hypothetical protein|nr:hypothetical protein [Anaerolineae bacterium]MBT7191329.1 hypothetical protein [Anaerolineae bacterium]MBT7991223.1 hypothetical protein [Anaerolineae bacterium]
MQIKNQKAEREIARLFDFSNDGVSCPPTLRMQPNFTLKKLKQKPRRIPRAEGGSA